MSGLRSEVDALYNAMVESQNIRVVQYPNTVAGVAVVSDGAAIAGAWAAYVIVSAALAAADPCWLLGISLGVPQVEAFYGHIAIASGAPAAEVDLAVVTVGTNVWPVVEWPRPSVLLPVPIKILGSPALSCRIRKDTGISLAGFANCNLICATGIGT